MTKAEFLKILREALEGEISTQEVQSNLAYYEEYIRTQAVGRSEEDVIVSLGSPQMIAKSIIEAFKASGEPFIKQEYYSSRGKNDSINEEFEEQNQQKKETKQNHVYHINLPKWVVIMVAVLLLFILFYIFLWIGGIVLKLLIRFGVPVLGIYILYRFIVNLKNQ